MVGPSGIIDDIAKQLLWLKFKKKFKNVVMSTFVPLIDRKNKF